MADLHKVCIDCKQPFIFSNAEQKYYEENTLADPKRCTPCRRKKRAHFNSTNHDPTSECFDCTPKFVRGVITDADHKCLTCGRLIEKSAVQYPVVRAV